MYENLIGNKNAEIWDEQTTINLFSAIYDKAREGRCYLLIHAINDFITIDQYEYLRIKYKDNKTISQLIKNILQTCELNITQKMMEGEVKETASIFLLKAKYGYVDKQQIEIEHKGSININFSMPDMEE